MIRELKKLMAYFKWIYNYSKSAFPIVLAMVLIDGVTALLSVAVALVSKEMVDQAVNQDYQALLRAVLVLGVIIIGRMGLEVISSLLSIKSGEGLTNHIRQRLFSKITHTQWAKITQYHSGDLVTRLTSDASAISSLVTDIVPNIFSLGVQLIASFAALYYFEPRLALLAFVLGPITVLFSRFWGKKLKRIQSRVQEAESAYRSYLQESIQNLLIIKAFRQEKNSVGQIDHLHHNRMKWVYKKNKLSLFASTMLALGYWAGYFLAFGWGAFGLGAKAITFGTLTAFLQLVEQIQSPFINLAYTLPRVISTLSSAERLLELDNLAEEKKSEAVQSHDEVGIKLNEIAFSYDDEKEVLKDVTIDIHPGEIVAVVGPSGEGKTTLIKNLLALLNPSKGSIVFYSENGVEYSSSTETRDYISYVPQGNTLFTGTIEENIRCGDILASEEELWKACDAADAASFIQELSEGLNSRVGERGIGLSEGQAQRIAIARAFLRRTPVLILDEATSALDVATEMHVLNAIGSLTPRRTCVVITHRPSALKICSKVLMIKEGTVKQIDKTRLEHELISMTESA